jgi:hypothetical protein
MGEQTLRPLTVKQIKNCTTPQESVFRVDNADVTQVSGLTNALHLLLFIVIVRLLLLVLFVMSKNCPPTLYTLLRTVQVLLMLENGLIKTKQPRTLMRVVHYCRILPNQTAQFINPSML